ncbi:MAG TPA: nucleoside hydrolase [Acidimicrobiia bacterium]
MRLWVDTDVGTNPDDTIALLCALARPDVELVAVSTVDDPDGERATVARRLVGDVPVTIGGLLDPDGFGACDPDAVLAIGPLTNIAHLVRAGHVPARLGVMGGALVPVQHRGALRRVEHNFGVDPDAARTVLDAVPDVLVCPLDVTVRTCGGDELRRRLTGAGSALRRPLAAYADRICLHDPLALLALLGEPVVRIERRRLTVAPDGAVRSGEGREHDVVVDADVPGATEHIVTLLEQGDRYTGSPAEDERP